MLLKAMFVAATAAVLVPLAGGTAHASCLDDLLANNLTEGYVREPKSAHWQTGYVVTSGTATVFVYGDALASDYTEYAATDLPNYAEAVSGNAVDGTTQFVDCVAG